MFETPYQTTPCARFDLSKTTAAVRRLEIDEQLVQPEGTPPGVYFVPVGATGFQPFQQPLTRVQIPTLEASVVMDGRSMLRADGTPNKLDVFRHAVLIATLTKMWYESDKVGKIDFLNIDDFAIKAFVWWASTAVQRLGLDMGQIVLLRAMFAVYYIQLHTPLDQHSTERERDKILSRAARVLPATDAYTLGQRLGEIPPLNNIRDFVEWTHKVDGSLRIQQLTIAHLNTALGYSFGPAHREAVAVALEYPPIFLALTYTALQERSYTKTGLGKVVQDLMRSIRDKDFVKNLNDFMGD